MDRRELLMLWAATAVLGVMSTRPASAQSLQLVFVHGRSQQGRSSDEIKAEWLGALQKGAEAIGRVLPIDLDVAVPFYGDKLDEFARAFEIPLTSDIHTRGDETQDEFLEFQADLAEQVRVRAGVTDAEIDMEYGDNPRQRGPQNWEWVQAILRALDKHSSVASRVTLETFTRDVFLYTRRQGVRDEIDGIVGGALTEQPTIVVAHSLGSVVAYNVLRTDRRNLQVPLYLTVGCPLGVRAVRDQLRPLKFPAHVKAWYNALDPRDVVALYPLDSQNFPITPAVENYAKVQNHTDNRHGIVGYLDNAEIVGHILGSLADLSKIVR